MYKKTNDDHPLKTGFEYEARQIFVGKPNRSQFNKGSNTSEEKDLVNFPREGGVVNDMAI